MTVTTTPGFRAEVEALEALYRTRPRPDAVAFAGELKRALRAIGDAPRLYSPVEDGLPGLEIREYHITRFSQRVLYVIESDDVLIFAVVHTSRREGTWHRRLGQ